MKYIIDWLTEDENPAIKYRTLTEICGKSFLGYQDVYNLIWEQKSITKMLEKQNEYGLWSDKDYGVHTPLRYLTAFAEHGLHLDKRLDSYVDYVIRQLQSYEIVGDLSGCSTPLTLRALVMLKYYKRDDVMDLVLKFSNTQLNDGGFMCKMKLDKNPHHKSCYNAAVASLLLYAECKRNNILLNNTESLIQYFIKRDIFYSSDKSKSLYEKGKIGWRFIDNFFPVEPMRMGLPLIVSALSILGIGNNPALTESWKLLKEKEGESGKLKLEGTLTKQPCSFGKVEQVNKWLTFYALLAKKYCP